MTSSDTALGQVINQAATDSVLPFVVGFAYVDEETDCPARLFGGGGACIKVAERYFVLTAAHVLHEATSRDRLMIISTRRPKNTSPRIRETLAKGGNAVLESADHCWLELDPRAAKTLESEFLSLDRMEPRPAAAGSRGMILGPPGEWTSLHARGVTLNLLPWISNIPTTPPGLGSDTICLEYAAEGRFGDQIVPLPNPRG